MGLLLCIDCVQSSWSGTWNVLIAGIIGVLLGGGINFLRDIWKEYQETKKKKIEVCSDIIYTRLILLRHVDAYISHHIQFHYSQCAFHLLKKSDPSSAEKTMQLMLLEKKYTEEFKILHIKSMSELNTDVNNFRYYFGSDEELDRILVDIDENCKINYSLDEFNHAKTTKELESMYKTKTTQIDQEVMIDLWEKYLGRLTYYVNKKWKKI